MPVTRLEEVFGVTRDHVLSYIERPEVDGAFVEALKSDKQIIVYGASKQGKTALVSKYLDYEKHIVVNCSPRSQVEDIYKAILRSAHIQIETQTQSSTGMSANIGVKATFKAIIPFFGASGVEATSKVEGNESAQLTSEAIEFNLELPQDICELLGRVRSKRFVILENFHYLDDDVQRQLAFDLRSFQELGLRFVILGVWREKNRLAQYNGDLLDRIVEIPVEPWDKEEFLQVAQRGEEKLNIKFADALLKTICEESFGSIGVVQELLKVTCINAGVHAKQSNLLSIETRDFLDLAIEQKAEDYSARHIRALEDIAIGRKSSNDENALYLPYYLVIAILNLSFEQLFRGIDRRVIEEEIKRQHHRAEGVRPSDISNLLYNLTDLQIKKNIVPPIFDFDRGQRTMKVIDSTFYFFLKHCDKVELIRTIPNPTLQ